MGIISRVLAFSVVGLAGYCIGYTRGKKQRDVELELNGELGSALNEVAKELDEQDTAGESKES
jgi:hypothetical protein